MEADFTLKTNLQTMKIMHSTSPKTAMATTIVKQLHELVYYLNEMVKAKAKSLGPGKLSGIPEEFKKEVGDSAPWLDQKVSELLLHFDRSFHNPTEKLRTLEYIRGELHNIMPAGKWYNLESKAQILKEVERVKTTQKNTIAEDPKARFRAALAKAKENHKNK